MKFTAALLTALAASCHAAVLGDRAVVNLPQCVPGPRIFLNGRVCIVSCGVDRYGGDYGLSRTGSFEACAQACGNDRKCVTAQYHEDSGFCYFKNVKNPAVSADGEDTIDCPAPNGTPCAADTDCASLNCNSNKVCARLL